MAGSRTIAVVDDDPALGEMLSIVLESEGFRSIVHTDGMQAWNAFGADRPDLALLDVMLPGLDGVELARRIRGHSNLPIIMLTAKSDTRDVIAGLNAGADDYVAKPFKVAELIARIRARLRVALPSGEGIIAGEGSQAGHAVARIAKGSISLDRTTHTAMKDSTVLSLTPMEFELLFALVAHAGQVLSRHELLKTVWGYHDTGDVRLVNVHIQRLRLKVEDNPELPQIIVTVRGVGYKFVAPASAA